MNTFILSTKNIPNLKLFHDEVKMLVPEFDGFLTENDIVTVLLTVEVTPELIQQIEEITPPNISQINQIQTIIANAMEFGNILMKEFAAENVLMGITQDGMTGTVRKRVAEVINCLITGSLYDAIIEIKAIPEENKDVKYLNNYRLTVFCNKIEDYLGIPRTLVT